MEVKINLHTSKRPFKKDLSYTCHFGTKVLAPSTLTSQVWAKYKEVSVFNQNIDASCKNKLKLTKLKDLCLKNKMNVHSSNSKTLKFQWKKYYGFWISILNIFTVGTE